MKNKPDHIRLQGRKVQTANWWWPE